MVKMTKEQLDAYLKKKYDQEFLDKFIDSKIDKILAALRSKP